MRDRRFGKEEESLGPVLVGVGAFRMMTSPVRAVVPEKVNVKIVVRSQYELPNDGTTKRYPTSTGLIVRNAYTILHAALVDLGSVHPGPVYEHVDEYVDGKLVKTYTLNNRSALVSVLDRVGMPPLSVSNTLPRPSPTRTAALAGAPDEAAEDAPPEAPTEPKEAAPAQVAADPLPAPSEPPGDLGALPVRELGWDGKSALKLSVSPAGKILVTVDRPGGATYEADSELRLTPRG